MPGLADILQLSAPQRDQMRGIWEQATETSRNCTDRHDELRKDFDQAVFDLLSSDQKARYNELSRDYQQELSKAGEQSRRRPSTRPSSRPTRF